AIQSTNINILVRKTRGDYRGCSQFQAPLRDFGKTELRGDDLTLLGNLDPPGDCVLRLREDCFVTGSTSATDRSTTAMKETELNVVCTSDLPESLLRLVKFPARREHPPVLVAVRVADHDFLQPSVALKKVSVHTV